MNRLKGYKLLIETKFREFKENKHRKEIRKQLTNRDFTIISNNCLGGGIYEDFGLVYNTPTVGLFFYAPCYIRFISNLVKNLELDLEFTQTSKYEIANKARKENPYPIGLIDDEIEIHFLHYKSQNEASEKWSRRKKRINYNNLFFSFSDNDLCTIKEIEFFDALPGNNVFFSAKNIPGIKSLVWLKQFEQDGKVGDLYSDPWLYRKYFDVVKWLNK